MSRIIRMRELKQILGVSEATIRRMAAKGTIPKPLKIANSRAVGWKEEDIQNYIDNMTQAS